MASKENIRERKRELISELAALRKDIGPDRSALTRRLNPVHGFSRQFSRHPLRTFGFTCLATGALTALLRRKPKPTKPSKPEKPRATMKGLLGSTFLAAIKPVAKRWVVYMVKQRYGDRFNPPSDNSLLGP